MCKLVMRWKGTDRGDYLPFWGPSWSRARRFCTATLPSFGKTGHQSVYLTLRWKHFFRTQKFSTARKTTQTNTGQKPSGKVNAFASRRLTTISPTVRRPDVLTKKPLDSVFLWSLFATVGIIYSLIYPWQLQASSNKIRIMQDAECDQIKQELILFKSH